jgi:glucokinase
MQQFIGIDVGGTSIKGATVLEDGSIITKEERATWMQFSKVKKSY